VLVVGVLYLFLSVHDGVHVEGISHLPLAEARILGRLSLFLAILAPVIAVILVVRHGVRHRLLRLFLEGLQGLALLVDLAHGESVELEGLLLEGDDGVVSPLFRLPFDLKLDVLDTLFVDLVLFSAEPALRVEVGLAHDVNVEVVHQVGLVPLEQHAVGADLGRNKSITDLSAADTLLFLKVGVPLLVLNIDSALGDLVMEDVHLLEAEEHIDEVEHDGVMVHVEQLLQLALGQLDDTRRVRY